MPGVTLTKLPLLHPPPLFVSLESKATKANWKIVVAWELDKLEIIEHKAACGELEWGAEAKTLLYLAVPNCQRSWGTLCYEGGSRFVLGSSSCWDNRGRPFSHPTLIFLIALMTPHNYLLCRNGLFSPIWFGISNILWVVQWICFFIIHRVRLF